MFLILNYAQARRLLRKDKAERTFPNSQTLSPPPPPDPSRDPVPRPLPPFSWHLYNQCCYELRQLRMRCIIASPLADLRQYLLRCKLAQESY
jgi:hypothetical protein